MPAEQVSEHAPDLPVEEPSSALEAAKPWWKTRPGLWSLGVGGLLVVLALGGGAYWYFAVRGAGDLEYIEVYVTDLPADMTALELWLDGAYVGPQNHSLVVDAPVFDLLSLQGPGQSLRVASGFVPVGNHTEVRLVFSAAFATINGTVVALAIPDAMLSVLHDFDGSASTSSALLLDIDADQSVISAGGTYEFRPFVANLYFHQYQESPKRGSDGRADPEFSHTNYPAFESSQPSEPRSQSTSDPSADMSPRQPSDGSGTDGGSGSDGGTGSNNSSGSPGEDLLPDLGEGAGDQDLGLINETLEEIGLFIQYLESDLSFVTAGLSALGLSISHYFPGGGAAYLIAETGLKDEIAAIEGVTYVEEEKPVDLTLSSSRLALRMPEVSNVLTGLRDASGHLIDGQGIGVAVIDSGIDATHSDLPYNDGIRASYTVVANYKVESVSLDLNLVSLPSTDTTSGHGTHVAGIIAGQGILDPDLRGVAPGAKLYGFGVGESSTTLWTNQALGWVLENHDRVDPPIRVVSNSWTTGTQYDPNALSSRLVRDLVAEGVVVVFAAGNNGGDGSSIRTSGEAQNPAEGVLSVANYNDFDDGRRTGVVYGSSSRGASGVPSSWPDLSAPGTSVVSTRSLLGLQSGLSLASYYTAMTGTSMSAPHVSAVVALMLQADPGLTPAQVESILESTAFQFTDGGAYASSGDARYHGSHYAKGHGLVDAYGAVQAALA